jgi:hypothetical protein
MLPNDRATPSAAQLRPHGPRCLRPAQHLRQTLNAALIGANAVAAPPPPPYRLCCVYGPRKRHFCRALCRFLRCVHVSAVTNAPSRDRLLVPAKRTGPPRSCRGLAGRPAGRLPRCTTHDALFAAHTAGPLRVFFRVTPPPPAAFRCKAPTAATTSTAAALLSLPAAAAQTPSPAQSLTLPDNRCRRAPPPLFLPPHSAAVRRLAVTFRCVTHSAAR